MNATTEIERERAVHDRRIHLINELYKMGVNNTRDGRNVEDVRLFTLEQVYINERCRSTDILQHQERDWW